MKTIEQQQAYELLMRARALAEEHPRTQRPGLLEQAAKQIGLHIRDDVPLVDMPSYPQQIGQTVNARIYDELYCLDLYTRSMTWGQALRRLDESWAEFDESQPRVNVCHQDDPSQQIGGH